MKLNNYNLIYNRNNFIILFFLFLILNYTFFNYRILFRENGYILGDWLINYNGGFVKRGLIGHLFFNLSKKLNISIIHIIFFFSTSIYIITLIVLYRIIRDKLNIEIVLIFLFLPSTLLFNFFDPLTVGRKEILVLFFFSIYYIYLENDKYLYKITIYLLSIFFLLSHEILFFQLPYLFLLRYLHLKKNDQSTFILKDYNLEILIFLSCFTLIFIIFIFTNYHDNNLLCKSLTEVGFTSDICYGAINDQKLDKVISGLWQYFIERNYLFNYLVYTLFTMAPLVYVYYKTENYLFKNKLIVLLLFCFLFSILFLPRVNDWGRYLNLTFLLQFLIFLKFIEIGLIKKNPNLNFKKYLNIFLILILLTSWHMPHCCNPKLGDGYYDIYSRVKSRIYDESENSTKFKDLPRDTLRKLFKID